VATIYPNATNADHLPYYHGLVWRVEARLNVPKELAPELDRVLTELKSTRDYFQCTARRDAIPRLSSRMEADPTLARPSCG
jgi:hypothetical protein